MVPIALNRYEISVGQLIYLMSITTTTLFYITSRYYNKEIWDIKPSMQWDLFWRVMTGVGCDVFLFLAYEYTYYSQAFALFWAGALSVPFFAACLLGEKIKKWDIIGILSGIIGMLMITSAIKSTESKSVISILFGDFLAIIGALTASLALVYIRKITSEEYCKGNQIFWSVQTFWFMFGLLNSSALWQYFAFDYRRTEYSLELYLWTFAMGVIFVVQQSLFVVALKIVGAGSVAVINYLAIPFSYFLDFLFFGRAFGVMELAGGCLIFLTNVLITWARIKKYID